VEVYGKIQTLFRRDLDGSITGQKGKMIKGAWTTPELEYLADNQWTFSAKVDGTNIRVGFHNNGIEFGGRTDRAVIPKPLMEHLNKTFTLDEMLPHFDIGNSTEVTLFGEGYGPNIQGGGKYRSDHSFILFDVYFSGPDGNFWLSRENVADVAQKLGIEAVPEIGQGTLHDAIDIVSTGITFTDTGAIKRWGPGYLESQWGAFPEEGLVCRPVVPLFDRAGRRIITKVKSVDFK
jgi:hypothetical protein